MNLLLLLLLPLCLPCALVPAPAAPLPRTLSHAAVPRLAPFSLAPRCSPRVKCPLPSCTPTAPMSPRLSLSPCLALAAEVLGAVS